MKQFHKFKQMHPDCILFFRMGDFYETFYEDAKVCSKVLGLTLTSRSKGTNPIPLAGVPYHAVDGYVKKMLQALIFSIDKTILDSMFYQVRGIFQVKLLEKICPVMFHSPYTY